MWENNDQEKENNFAKLDDRGRLRCPMCKGRGFFDPTQAASQSLNEKESEEKLKLPRLDAKADIREPSRKWNKVVSLPSIRNINNLPEARSTEKPHNSLSSFGVNQSKDLGYVRQNKTRLEQISRTSKPSNVNTRLRTPSSNPPSEVSSADSEYDKQMLPSPRPPTNPMETLRTALNKLKNNDDWSNSVDALKEIAQVARFHAALLENSMTIIYRNITALLKGLRPTGIRVACQAVNEIFINIPNTQRPEFDELGTALLQKTADMNKWIRQDANKALDSMVVHTSPVHSVRVIVQKGMAHKNPIVRTSAARLLSCVVGITGVDSLFAGHKETRGRILTAAAYSMQDGCQEVRNYGRRLMKMLMAHDDFEEILQTEVNGTLLKRIDKALVTMKYQT